MVPDGAIMLYCGIPIERIPRLQNEWMNEWRKEWGNAQIVTESLFAEYPGMLLWLDLPIYNTHEKDEQ